MLGTCNMYIKKNRKINIGADRGQAIAPLKNKEICRDNICVNFRRFFLWRKKIDNQGKKTLFNGLKERPC